MIGTLIAPLALLYNYFELKQKGSPAEAVQYLAKLFRLSSMPREYISLLMAEMLPVIDGSQRSLSTNCPQKSETQHLVTGIYLKSSRRSKIMSGTNRHFRKDRTCCHWPFVQNIILAVEVRSKAGEKCFQTDVPLGRS